jgi:type III pantothenate kinase
MNIVADFGNTAIKIGLVDNQTVSKVFVFDSVQPKIDEIFSLFEKSKPEKVCFLSVSKIHPQIKSFLFGSDFQVIEFSHETSLPFSVNYNPAASLGIDRLAGVVGARALYPGKDLLVVQSGTCITYDVYFEKQGYIGGAISPGVDIRNKAMNTFTFQLPLVTTDKKQECSLIANNTTDALLSGIFNGALFEIQGFIDAITQISKDVHVVFSGGNMIYFVNKIKSKIFANSNLTLTGLTEIIRLNEQNKNN